MILEFHAIQSFAPANLNRDDTGAPKDCVFGGVRRARISSQSFKRAMRTEFRAARVDRGVRSRRLARLIVERAAARGVESSVAATRAATLLARPLLGLTVERGEDGETTTAQLIFLRDVELDALAEIVDVHGSDLDAIAGSRRPSPPAPLRTAIQSALTSGERGLDVALFGRMVAEFPLANVDAACQVAHALGTHRLAGEFDYFTAVDDIQPEDSAGAGMIGTVQFNASCFYRYASLDTDLLRRNLGPAGDDPDVVEGVSAFADAFARAIPNGKQNTFAAHNPPASYLVVSRASGQWNLANAFAVPVTADATRDLAGASTTRLLEHLRNLQRAYSREEEELQGALLDVERAEASATDLPDGITRVTHLDDVRAFVGGAVASAG